MMKKLTKNTLRTFALFTFAGLVLGSNPAKAHGGLDRDGHHQKQDLLAELDLSDEQLADIAEIKAATREARQAIFSNDDLSREEKREQLRVLRKTSKEQIYELLTDEQREQLEALRAERKQARIDRKVERLTKALDLDELRVALVRDLLQEAQSAKEAIKDSEATPQEKREQLQAHREQVKTDIKAVLNPEQAQKFEESSNRPGKKGGKGKGRRPRR